MTAQPPARRRRLALTAGSIALLILALVAAGVGYTNYRVDRFSDSVFRDDSVPPQTQFGAPDPTATPAATPTLAPPTPTHDPRDPNTPTPAPTATTVPTATPTPLPYGNSPVIRRLRAGERITVLLVGFGGPGHDGGYLTDSLQVLSFEPRTATVTLISIPRDLWVQIPPFEGRGGYWGKINEAYAVGMGQVDRDDNNVPYQKHDKGGQLASRTVAQVLGLPIDYWVSLDFVGFRQFIDAIGGVEVNVERAFTDTQYPANDDASVDPNPKTVHFDAGPQRLDGERALQFARSRYAPEDGSDFGRARRQQLLIAAVRDQIFRVETIPKLFGVLDALQGHLRMSFSFTEARDLAGWAQEQARARRQFTTRGGVIGTENLLFEATSPGGAYILLPQHGQGDYSAIHSYVRETLGEPVFGPSWRATPAGGTPARATPGTPTRGTPGTPGAPVPFWLITPTVEDRGTPTPAPR